ncbi:MAG: DUF6544 family protein [Clostridium sp.]
MLKKFRKSMLERVSLTEEENEIYKEKDLENLPVGMKRYFRYIECIGKLRHNVVNVIFEDVDFVMSNKNLKMRYDLWLFKDEPYRAAGIKTSLYGIPFDGLDYSDEKRKVGGMKGKLAKIITVVNEENEQIYKAGLIAWIIEGTMNPSILLSKYISYREIDKNNVEVTVSYNGVLGKGIFTIDDEGKIIEFFSDERQREKINGVETDLGWRCSISGYRKINNIRVPSEIGITTIYEDKEVEYFKAKKIKTIYYK